MKIVFCSKKSEPTYKCVDGLFIGSVGVIMEAHNQLDNCIGFPFIKMENGIFILGYNGGLQRLLTDKNVYFYRDLLEGESITITK